MKVIGILWLIALAPLAIVLLGGPILVPPIIYTLALIPLVIITRFAIVGSIFLAVLNALRGKR